jgi:hypothetical protein
MSYDISYFLKETYNNPEQRELVQVSHFMAEGGTIKAELIYGELVPAIVQECEMNITYNYSPFYYKHIDSELGLRWLYGKTGSEVKERLEKAIFQLGIKRNESPFWQIDTRYTIGQLFEKVQLPISEEKNAEYLKVEDWDNHPDKDLLIRCGYLRNGGSYWKPTPGNAGYALMRILSWIIQNPDGIFGGD